MYTLGAVASFPALPGTFWCQQVWRERPVILLAIVAVMGLIELTVGREDYGSSEAEPGKLGEFWQAARPADPQVWGTGAAATGVLCT